MQKVNIDWDKLKEPFPEQDIEWRVGSRTKDKSRGIALAYVTSRAIMNRLDEVVGPENWKDEYMAGPDGGVMCKLSIKVYHDPENGFSEWLTKSDGAENTDIEEVKGGISGALKRAAVKFGIGRYLYYLDNEWVPLRDGRYLEYEPDMPEWALPGGKGRPEPAEKRPRVRTQEQQAAADRVHKNVAEAAPEASPVWPWADEFQTYMNNYPDVAKNGEWVAFVIGDEPTMESIDRWLHESEDNDFEKLFGEARRAGIEMEASNEKEEQAALV